MKDEVRRIMTLVKEGKLSPEDAAELIDAFMASEPAETAAEPTESGGAVPPPPPPPTSEAPKDPFRTFIDFIEGFGKDVSEKVDWKDVASHVRTAAEKGMEGIKSGVEQIRQGKVNFGWFGSQESREVTLPFNLPAGKLLRIENACGNVRVAGGFEESSVFAKAVLKAASPEEAKVKAEAFTLIVEESEHQVLIRQADISGLEVDFVVQLAGPAQIEAKTHAGDIRVLDTGAGCRLTTSAGDVHVRGIHGVVEVVCQAGDIHIEDCNSPSVALEAKSGDIALLNVNGNVNARTASGDLRGRNLAGKTYSVESVSGDISLDFREPVTGTVNVRPVNNSAEIFLPDGSDCRVSLSTLKGTTTCDVPLIDEARLEGRVTGRLGAGAGNIDVSSVNGDINFRWRDAAQT